MVGSEPKIVRLNPLISPVLQDGKWTLPKDFDKDIFEILLKLELDAIKEEEVSCISYLGSNWLLDRSKNQGIRTNSSLEVEIGYKCYSEGKKA